MHCMQTSRSILRLCRISQKLYSNGLQYSTVTTNTAEKSLTPEITGRWQIVGATCITRPPVICPPMTPMEKEYSEMISKMEKENSLKNDHELRREQDMIRAELLKSGDADDADIEESPLQTALEFEDACVEELKATEFAPKVTEADKNGDLGTLDRALDRSLVLLVKQKLGEDYRWILPQSPWVPGETLRQTCERVVEERCGSNLKVKFLGNAPCGFYKYKYPKQLRSDGFIGAKVFFYKAQVRGVNGEVLPGSDIAEHQWLTHDQLDDRFKRPYAKSVSKFLVSDQ